MFMGINLSQSDDDVARQHQGSRVGHRDNDKIRGVLLYVDQSSL